MAQPLKLTCSLSSNTIPASAEPRLLYLLMEIENGDHTKTLPSNLSFIIDTSDSMHIRLVTDEQFTELARDGRAKEIMTDGVPAYQIQSESLGALENYPRRIDFVSEALMASGEYLRPADWFSVIAFASQAHCLVPATLGNQRQRLQEAARELEFLRLGDRTQMAEGLSLALSQISEHSNKSYADRMILLTDGHTQNVKECYELAERARQAGIKLSTMGMGVEFNEDLLIPLADLTGGNAYYIQSPDQIPAAFRQELGTALRISYRNVEIKLNVPDGVQIRNAYRVLPELSDFDQGPNQNGSYSLFVGDYDSAEPVSFLAEVLVPALPFGDYRLAQVLFTWDDPSAEIVRQNQRQDIHVSLSGESQIQSNDRVMNIVEKVGVYKMGTNALLAAQQASGPGDSQEKQQATRRLRQAATRLLDMGVKDLAGTMLQQVEILENQGSLDSEAAKKIRYETRRITKHT